METMDTGDRGEGSGGEARRDAGIPPGDRGQRESDGGRAPGDRGERAKGAEATARPSDGADERGAAAPGERGAAEPAKRSAGFSGHERQTQTDRRTTAEVAVGPSATVDKGIQTDARQQHCCGAAVEAPDPCLLQSQQNTAKSGIQQIIECFRTGTTQLKHLLLREVDTIFECRACRSLFRGLPNLVLHKEAYCCSWEHLPESSTSGRADRHSQAVRELLEAIYPRADRPDYVVRLEPISTNSNACAQSVRPAGDVPGAAAASAGATGKDSQFNDALPSGGAGGDTDLSSPESDTAPGDAAAAGGPSLPIPPPPPPPSPGIASSVNRMCRICGKVFASRKSARRHIKVIHHKPPEEVGRFIGGSRRTGASETGVRAGAVGSPSPTVSEVPPAPAGPPPSFVGKSCPLCCKSFATKANARRHFDEVHLGVRRDPGAVVAAAAAPGSASARGSVDEDDDNDDDSSSDSSSSSGGGDGGEVGTHALSRHQPSEREAPSEAKPAFPTGWGGRAGAAVALPGRDVTCTSASAAAKRSGVAQALGVSDAAISSLDPVVNLSCVISSGHTGLAKQARADEVVPELCTPQPAPPAPNGVTTAVAVSGAERGGGGAAAEPPARSRSRRKSSTPMSHSTMEMLLLLETAPHSPASSCDLADLGLREPGEVVRNSAGAEEDARRRQQQLPFRTSMVETRAKRRSVGADGYGYGAGRSGPAADWDMETKMCLRCHRQYTTAQTLKRHMLLIHRRDIGRVEGDSDSSSGGDGACGRRQRQRRRRRDRSRRSRQRAPHRALAEAKEPAAPAVTVGTPRAGSLATSSSSSSSSTASSADDSDGGGGGERCDVCAQKFPTKAGLKRHICSAHGRHDAAADGLSRSQQLLALAARTARAAQGRRLKLSLGFDMKRLYCKLCKRCFTNRANMLRHIELHSDRDEGGGIYVKFYRCPMCVYETRRKRDVVRHITMVHKKRSRDLAKIVGGLESRAVKKPIDAFLSRGANRGKELSDRAGDSADEQLQAAVLVFPVDPSAVAGAAPAPAPAPAPWPSSSAKSALARPPATGKSAPCREKSQMMANGRADVGDAASPALHKCPVCRKAFAKKTCLTLHCRVHRREARAAAAATGGAVPGCHRAALEERAAAKSSVRHTRSKALQPSACVRVTRHRPRPPLGRLDLK